MKGKEIIFEKDECYCCLFDFFKKSAEKLDMPVTEDTLFDCRDINVTREVADELWNYYKREEGMNDFEIGTLFLLVGPKANVNKSGENLYLAEVFDGFVTVEQNEK